MMKVDGIFGWREKWRLMKFETQWFIQTRTGRGEYGHYKYECGWCEQDYRGYGEGGKQNPWEQGWRSEPYRRAALIAAAASAKDWKDLRRICDELISREEDE